MFQPGGEREGAMELEICLGSKEEIKTGQLFPQHFRVTREALNIAARLMAKMDLNEIRPKSLR